MTEPENYFDRDLNAWVCGMCNHVLRSDGECTTRACYAKNELKRLGIENPHAR